MNKICKNQLISLISRNTRTNAAKSFLIRSLSTRSFNPSLCFKQHEPAAVVPVPVGFRKQHFFTSSKGETKDLSKTDGENMQVEVMEQMSESEFQEIADEFLEDLTHMLDILEDTVEDFDCNYSQGVLTMKLGEYGTWVLNKQAPNRQIWWSSPISGPMRFEYDSDDEMWINTRNKEVDLLSLFQEEIAETTGVEIHSFL